MYFHDCIATQKISGCAFGFPGSRDHGVSDASFKIVSAHHEFTLQEIGRKIRGILPPRRQEDAEKKTQRKRARSENSLDLSLPPLRELGVLAVKLLDFED